MDTPTLPTETTEAPAGPGHNKPPADKPYDVEAFNKLKTNADAFLKASDVWQKQDVTSDALAEQLADQIAGLRKNRKAVDTARLAERKPLQAKLKVIQDDFTPLLERYDRALKVLLAKSQAWLDKKQAELDAQKEKERQEAAAKEAEARRMAMDAEQSGSIDAQLEAEKAAKDAEKAQKSAAKTVKASIGSASGAGRTVASRKRKVAQIDNIRLLFMHFQEHEKVREVLQALANQEANSAGFQGAIPGCTITTKTTAA